MAPACVACYEFRDQEDVKRPENASENEICLYSIRKNTSSYPCWAVLGNRLLFKINARENGPLPATYLLKPDPFLHFASLILSLLLFFVFPRITIHLPIFFSYFTPTYHSLSSAKYSSSFFLSLSNIYLLLLFCHSLVDYNYSSPLHFLTFNFFHSLSSFRQPL